LPVLKSIKTVAYQKYPEKSGAEKAAAIVLAAGRGLRAGLKENKALALLGGKRVLEWSLAALEGSPLIQEIIIAAAKRDYDLCLSIAAAYSKVVKVTIGGGSRQESAAACMPFISPALNWVFIHDAARPFLKEAYLRALLAAAAGKTGAVLGAPLKNTLKERSKEGLINKTLPRENLWEAQTPQLFAKKELLQAYAGASAAWLRSATDDAAILEAEGGKIALIEGSYNNIKLTTAEDFILAEILLAKEKKGGAVRIGHGFDVHPLTEGRPLIIGGVNIPFAKGLQGHSDADVLAHALADALLGAAALGDIGVYFPPGDKAFKNISSLFLLAECARMLKEAGYEIINADSVIIAEKPKLLPYTEQMRENLAQALGADKNAIGIKATTTEGLGFCGREEGIAASAVVLLREVK
jgi:2-C-methyl-D-erythritol 2,4-cyclodiphosphate synthase/2-C-methyl-D-erythritol 4-phosphate cytidylyltransferase